MKITNFKIQGLHILEPEIFEDERGYFYESFREEFFETHFPDIKFVQENESKSQKGVLRGLHFQEYPHHQTKLVRVVLGEILDIAVDIRKSSQTFGCYESVRLSDENKKQFLIPSGFAHGFLVVSDYAIVTYKVDNYYAPSHDNGIIYNDPELNIDWGVSEEHLIISEKDLGLSTLSTISKSFD